MPRQLTLNEIRARTIQECAKFTRTFMAPYKGGSYSMGGYREALAEEFEKQAEKLENG